MDFYENIEPTIEPVTVDKLIEMLKMYIPNMKVEVIVPDKFGYGIIHTSDFVPSVEEVEDGYVLTFKERK